MELEVTSENVKKLKEGDSLVDSFGLNFPIISIIDPVGETEFGFLLKDIRRIRENLRLYWHKFYGFINEAGSPEVRFSDPKAKLRIS